MLLPEDPLPSIFKTIPISFARGCWLKKASAPTRPISSASVRIIMIGCLNGASNFRALAASSIATTPAPSSPAPGAIGTES